MPATLPTAEDYSAAARQVRQAQELVARLNWRLREAINTSGAAAPLTLSDVGAAFSYVAGLRLDLAELTHEFAQAEGLLDDLDAKRLDGEVA